MPLLPDSHKKECDKIRWWLERSILILQPLPIATEKVASYLVVLVLTQLPNSYFSVEYFLYIYSGLFDRLLLAMFKYLLKKRQ